MIGTTRGARHLVAALAAVLLAGVVGVVSASSSRTETERAVSSLTRDDGTSAQHRVAAVVAPADQQHATVDLVSSPPQQGLLLLFAFVAAVAAAGITAHGRVPVSATGRSPPRG